MEPLKKVTLSFEAGTNPDSMDLIPRSAPFDFIFGLGTQGLTPFEFQLADKDEGDEVSFPLKRGDMDQFFQHLSLPELPIPGDRDTFYLRVRVMKVVPADQKEVIKALAEIASCDDHCCGH
jgi:hypothetical protein